MIIHTLMNTSCYKTCPKLCYYSEFKNNNSSSFSQQKSSTNSNEFKAIYAYAKRQLIDIIAKF